MNTPTPTPGYNRRITIWFDTDKHGMRVAYYLGAAMRAIRLPLDDAEIMRAGDTADVTCCHPLRPHKCGR